jgi:hypothetical protein
MITAARKHDSHVSRPEAGRPLCPEYAVWRSGYPT